MCTRHTDGVNGASKQWSQAVCIPASAVQRATAACTEWWTSQMYQGTEGKIQVWPKTNRPWVPRYASYNVNAWNLSTHSLPVLVLHCREYLNTVKEQRQFQEIWWGLCTDEACQCFTVRHTCRNQNRKYSEILRQNRDLQHRNPLDLWVAGWGWSVGVRCHVRTNGSDNKTERSTRTATNFLKDNVDHKRFGTSSGKSLLLRWKEDKQRFGNPLLIPIPFPFMGRIPKAAACGRRRQVNVKVLTAFRAPSCRSQRTCSSFPECPQSQEWR